MQSESAPVKTARIPALDGWRGIAILLVLLEHYRPQTATADLAPRLNSLGIHGVTIFFVLSGYLITTTLLNEYRASGSISLPAFYIRRLFRLMPAAWCYLALLVTIHWISRQDLLACLFFLRNFIRPVHTCTEHFWSLSIEEQFYLVWPLLLLVTMRRNRRTPFYLAATASVIFAIWKAFDYSQLAGIYSPKYFWTQYHADALLVGCAGALLPWTFTPSKKSRIISMASLIALAFCVIYLRKVIPLYESILIAVCIQATATGHIKIVQKILDAGPLKIIGQASYSIYVFQQPVLFLRTADPLTMVMKWLVAIGFGVFMYAVAESPIRKYGRHLAAQVKNKATLQSS